MQAQTPIIVGISLEPICAACGASLRLQEGSEGGTNWGQCDTNMEAVSYVQDCPKCGRPFASSVISWRVRSGNATD